jgi:hypothetical protein
MSTPEQPSQFKTALNHWFEMKPTVSQMALSDESKVPGPDLSKFRSGKRHITFEALSKLLPAVEKLSSRLYARTLLVAYLNDETPADYTGDVRVYAVDENTGAVEKDIIATTRDRWESRARSDATFATWWLTTDGYMHEADTDAVDARAIQYQQEHHADLALVAEDPPQDTVITLPTQHPVQKALDDITAQFSQTDDGNVNKKADRAG